MKREHHSSTKSDFIFFIVTVMMVCLLAGCESSGETPPSDTVEMVVPIGMPTDPVEETSTVLAAETLATQNNVQFSFADIATRKFWFGSGAGAWCTELIINIDGTFMGEFHDSDVRTLYWCGFTGKFTEPVKVDDYTFSVKLEQIKLEREPGTEETKDGMRYIYSEPYGLDEAEELLIYLPGTPVELLSEECLQWMRGRGEYVGTELPFYGLYNVNGKQGYSSWTIHKELESMKYYITYLEEKLHTNTLSQTEMTETASILYNLWDDKLNEIWTRLKHNLDESAMDDLVVEERKWIAYKESEMKKAGDDVKNDTPQLVAEYMMGAKLTKERVYELVQHW